MASAAPATKRKRSKKTKQEDESDRTDAQRCVIELTTAGQDDLDETQLKRLKQLCKKSDEHVVAAHAQLMIQLEKPHSQIRFAAVKLIDELFSRSHAFRVLLVDDFQTFLELAVGLDDVTDPLPPPKQYAGRMRQLSLECVNRWHEKYGTRFKQIALGHSHLRTRHNVNFEDISHRSRAALLREQEREQRKKEALNKLFATAKQELTESQPEVEAVLKQMETTFKLLVPDPKDLPESVVSPAATESPTPEPMSPSTRRAFDRQALIRDLGLGSADYNIVVSVSAAAASAPPPTSLPGESSGSGKPRSTGNEALVASLRDSHLTCKKRFLPKVQKWLAAFQKSDNPQARQLIIKALDIKDKLKAVEEKYRVLMNVDDEDDDDEDEEDDDLEDVPELLGRADQWVDTASLRPAGAAAAAADAEDAEGSMRNLSRTTSVQSAAGSSWTANQGARSIHPEEVISFAAAPAQNNKRRRVSEKETGHAAGSSRPSSSAAAASSAVSEEEQKKRMMELAPVVPYGIDLTYWGKEDEVLPPDSSMTSIHRFWQPIDADEYGMRVKNVPEFTTRKAFLVNTTAPDTKECRVPVDGKSGEDGQPLLCKRRGASKCPLHGLIVPRDDKGNPTPEGAQMLAKAAAEAPQPDTKPKVKKRRSNLIDVSQAGNTTRSRLMKKTKHVVLGAIDPALDKLRADKHRDNWVVPE